MPLGNKVEPARRGSGRDELDTRGMHGVPLRMDLQAGLGVDTILGAHVPALQLATVPLLTRAPLPHDGKQEFCASVFESDPAGLAAEQFRLMQRRLTNVRPAGGSVLLTSPGAGEGKSLNAHNIAWALAEAKHDTLLLELDLRRPSQSKYFRVHPAESISSVLSGDATSSSAVRRMADVPLYFIGQDSPVSNPTGLLRSDALRELISWALRNFAWVVVDAPPILPIADVEELLPVVDLVLMIVRERTTPRLMVKRAAERLGSRLNYVILNDVVLSTAYGYGYSYP